MALRSEDRTGHFLVLSSLPALALSGSGKAFIHTSGSSIVGTRSRGERSDDIFDEDTPITPSPARVARATDPR